MELETSFDPVPVDDLITQDIPPTNWLIDRILPPGLAMIAGGPKSGKSFLAGNAAIGVAQGGSFLGAFDCTKGGSLYLDLEQTKHRAARRWEMMLAGHSAPGLATVWRWPIWEEGLKRLGDYLDRNEQVRFVVIDVLQTFQEGKGSAAGNAYQAEYSDMMKLRDLAHGYEDRGLCLLLIHHTNKAAMFETDAFRDNPLAGISGSTAISGACDTVWVLTRKAGKNEGNLSILGKEVAEWDLKLKWHPAAGVWAVKDRMKLLSSVPT